MNSRHLKSTLVCLAVLGALSAAPVMAQTTTSPGTPVSTSTTNQESTRLSTEFTSFAGSSTNSQALVTGLRDGTAITLTETTPATATTPSTTTTTTFTPATGKMGYGNVKIALSLTEAILAKDGITDPTPAEMAAALNGGKLVLADGTSVDLKGVLAQRAAGEGWGQIAKADGFKLGEVVRSPKGVGSAAAHGHEHAHVEKVELAKAHDVDHASKPEHVSKVDRPDRPSRPDRPEHPDHPDHAGRPGG